MAEDPKYWTEADHCEDFLLRLSDESLPDENPKPLTASGTRYRILVVPGLFNECFASIALPFEASMEHLHNRGFRIDQLVVSGRSSSDRNAAHIADVIGNMNLESDEALVLVGHSKGAVDILHFLINHPEQARQVVAVVSLAGAINGSPLAKKYGSIYTNLAKKILLSSCDPGDGGAIDSLRYSTSLSWLDANPLPDSVAFFSLVAFTKRENINLLLRNGYDTLAAFDPRNDGQLLSADQIIPGSTLMAYVNADHWTVAVPVEEAYSGRDPDTIARNKELRTLLLVAMILFIVERLQ